MYGTGGIRVSLVERGRRQDIHLKLAFARGCSASNYGVRRNDLPAVCFGQCAELLSSVRVVKGAGSQLHRHYRYRNNRGF